ncbi:hypothetical protein L1887_54818 [Cichorium endivia]|nr:hypothetical protein L1887_54818 [Cichorium endivia]
MRRKGETTVRAIRDAGWIAERRRWQCSLPYSWPRMPARVFLRGKQDAATQGPHAQRRIARLSSQRPGALFTHDTHSQDFSRLWLCWAIRAKRTSVHLKFGGQRSPTERFSGPGLGRFEPRGARGATVGRSLIVARRLASRVQLRLAAVTTVQATRRLATRRRTHGESCIDPDGRAASNASLEPRRTGSASRVGCMRRLAVRDFVNSAPLVVTKCDNHARRRRPPPFAFKTPPHRLQRPRAMAGVLCRSLFNVRSRSWLRFN